MAVLSITTIARWACRPLLVAVALTLAFLMPYAALAQAPAKPVEPTAITIAASDAVQLGERVTVQARLGSNAGPLAKVTVDFTVPMTFLNNNGDMVVASAVTDAQGLATGQFQARTSGQLTVNAVFRGDSRFAGSQTFAASQASAPFTVTGDRQLYQQEVLPSVPGINAPPVASIGASGTTRWLFTGWPIPAVLILVWSSYAVAVFSMSRIAASASEAAPGADGEQGPER